MTPRRTALVTLTLLAGAAVPATAQTLEFVDNLPGTFIDISDTGTPLNLSGDDSAPIMTTIGNTVFPAGRVAVGNNGGLGFDPPDDFLAPLNEMIPSNNAFGGGQGTLIFWDDIGNDVGDVFWIQLSDRFIVQWHDHRFEGSQDTARFQIQVFDNVGPSPQPIYAQFIYADIEQPRADGGLSATIGYQDGAAGFNDVQWSFNTAGAVANGTVLSLIPEPSAIVLVAGGLLVVGRRR